MKITTKLVLVMLVLIIVPMLAINIYSSTEAEKSAVQLVEDNISNLTLNRAGSINFYFEEITSAAKELASSDELSRFTSDSNNGIYDNESEEYRNILKDINDLITVDISIQKVMVINNSGDIIISTDDSDIGKQMSNYSGLFSVASGKSGVSTFFMSSERNDGVPVFFVAKPVYSKDNQRQGIVYQLYDTNYLQRLISNVQFDKYTASAIMDQNGNLFEYPYKTLKMYSESDKFGEAADYLRDFITEENATSEELGDTYEYGVKRGVRVVHSATIESCGWTMLNVSDRFRISQEVGRIGSSIRNFSIIMMIISCVGCGVFIYFFTKPVHNIIDTLRKKLKGDYSAKFDINTHDEFREISGVLEAVFEESFELEQRYKTIVDITNNIVFEINMENAHVTVSKNFNQKFDLRPKDDSMSESFIHKLRVHKDDKERFNSDFNRILGKDSSFQGEYRVKDTYGEFIWIMIKATKFYNRNDVPIKIIGVIMDIDKEKKSEMHLIQKANFDNLTQLFNRETFLKGLGRQLELAAHKKTLDAMMFIDLDDFKFFNDQYGHACGDEVLKFVADTLKEFCFEHGFAGRFGGDEFVACITDLTLYGDSGKIAQEIIDTLGEGFISESTGAKLNIHCSIGIAFLIESGKTTEDVVAAADEAMYNIKKHGKSAYAYAKSHATAAEAFIDDVIT